MTNLLNKLEEKLSLIIELGIKKLLKGELYELEQWVREQLNDFYTEIMRHLLETIGTSRAFMKQLGKLRSALHLGKLKKRRVDLQIGNGETISFMSYYAERGRNFGYEGNFHMSLLYWHCIKKASPLYYSSAGLLSILCPSFDIATQLLGYFGIKSNYNRIRELSILLGKQGKSRGISSTFKPGESLENRRVVISMDGGRSRTREYTGKQTKKGNPKFETPWKEPKLFVIQVVDDHGQHERKTALPLYGSTMGDINEFLSQLKQALSALKIHLAKEVQFIADGALCFWTNIRQVFLDLGLSPKKTTYTLDYYHAVEHLNELVGRLPVEEQDKKSYTKQFMDYLWNGTIYSIDKRVRNCFEKANKIMDQDDITALDYFIKHTDHMQYARFKRKKWLCGSGLVESAIRRIVNLRFKGASSFWLVENLEPLLFLRSTFLAGRWNYFMNSLTKKWWTP